MPGKAEESLDFVEWGKWREKLVQGGSGPSPDRILTSSREGSQTGDLSQKPTSCSAGVPGSKGRERVSRATCDRQGGTTRASAHTQEQII